MVLAKKTKAVALLFGGAQFKRAAELCYAWTLRLRSGQARGAPVPTRDLFDTTPAFAKNAKGWGTRITRWTIELRECAQKRARLGFASGLPAQSR